MWVKAIALFRSRDVEDFMWDDMSSEQQDENCEEREFRFDSDELFCFNEARNAGTTLRFKSGYDITVTMTVAQLDKIIFNLDT